MIAGIDVSTWQDEMDWPKARSAGAEFAFIRAGSINSITGECYKDYQFDRNSEIGPEHMPCAYYWYSRPKFDGKKQADYFMGLIHDKRGFGWVNDIEVVDTSYDEALRQTMNLSIRMGQIHPGKKILYSRALWWNSTMHRGNLTKLDWAASMDLWIARYHSGIQHPWGDGYCKPIDWDDWKFWQWSADGNGLGPTYGGNSNSMDLNRFNGDLADFNRYIGKEVPAKPTFKISVPASVGEFIIEVTRT